MLLSPMVGFSKADCMSIILIWAFLKFAIAVMEQCCLFDWDECAKSPNNAYMCRLGLGEIED